MIEFINKFNNLYLLFKYINKYFILKSLIKIIKFSILK